MNSTLTTRAEHGKEACTRNTRCRTCRKFMCQDCRNSSESMIMQKKQDLGNLRIIQCPNARPKLRHTVLRCALAPITKVLKPWVWAANL